MVDKKWKLVSSKPLLETKWMSVFSNSYELPDGKVQDDYLHLDRPNYVLIVAFDENGNIVLEKNYRRGVDDFVYELPAGWIDKGESPEDAGQRELKEETGYISDTKLLGEIYAQPGFSSIKAYVVLAKITEDNKGEQELGHDEHIYYELLSEEKVDQMIKENKIKDMGALAGISMYKSTK